MDYIAWVISVAIFILSALFSTISYLTKKTVIEKIENLSVDIKELSSKFQNFEIDVIKNYVTKNEYAQNIQAHENIWEKVNEHRDETIEKVTITETKIENIEKSIELILKSLDNN